MLMKNAEFMKLVSKMADVQQRYENSYVKLNVPGVNADDVEKSIADNANLQLLSYYEYKMRELYYAVSQMSIKLTRETFIIGTHSKGYTVKDIVAWLNANIEDYIEYTIDEDAQCVVVNSVMTDETFDAIKRYCEKNSDVFIEQP